MRIVGLFLIAAILFFPALSAGLDVGVFGRVIRTIEYRADQPLERSHYDASLGLKPGDVLSRSGLKRAIQGLHDTGRFSSIAVEGVDEGEEVGLVFNLRFNYYFNQFSIAGKVDLDGRAPWEIIPLPVGERFSAAKLEEARQNTLKYMHDRGYFLAEVQPRTIRDEKTRQIDVVFNVEPGELATISSIEITGVPAEQQRSIAEKLRFTKGEEYDRRRLRHRLDNLKDFFIKSGYLAAVAEVSETFESSTNTVAVRAIVTNFGRIRVAVDGFKIEKNQLTRLLPILSGEGLSEAVLAEGARNIGDYLEEQGYPEGDVDIHEETDKSGARLFRYVINAGHKVTVAYVRFEGNRALAVDELLDAVRIQPARFLQKSVYSISKLDSDVDALQTMYRSRGYLEARVIPLVEPVGEGETLGITFRCVEGVQSHVESLSIQGNRKISMEELERKIKLKPDAPYSPHFAEQDRQSLLAAYNDAGFLQARVDCHASAEDANTYRVVFEIQEGIQSFIEQVVVLGNELTRDSVIAKRVKLRPDEPLSMGKLLSTQQELYKLGLFDLVRVAPQNPESEAAYQNVIVRLAEAKRYTLHYGFGYQERDKLRGTVELSDLNLFGLGRRVDVRLRGSAIEQGGALTFQQPQVRLLPVNSYFTISERKKREVSFDVTRLDVSYQLGHPLSGHSWALLRYNFRNVRTSREKVPPDRENTPRNLSTFSVFYINDTRNDYLDPERGFFTSTDFGVTTKLLGSNDYYSLFTQNSYYHRLPTSMLAAFSFRFGVAHPFGGDTTIPLSERYFAGGGSSLRGFETDFAGPLDHGQPVGGNALVIANIELRTPLFRSIHLAAFYDAGNVFQSLSAIRLSGIGHTIGLGLRVKTPFGPLRADYGYNLNLSSDARLAGLKPGHFFITIGPPF